MILQPARLSAIRRVAMIAATLSSNLSVSAARSTTDVDAGGIIYLASKRATCRPCGPSNST
jgi:hypothetical protein